jgi:hypothetical protein
MTVPPAKGSLYDAFGHLRDTRKARGQLYFLPALLTLATTALLCGCRSLYAIAQWGRAYNHLAPLLGFTRRSRDGQRVRTPCTSELHTVFAALDVAVFEKALSAWVVAQGVADLEQRLVALDGKVRRGSQGDQRPGVHLVDAYCPDV